MKKIEQAIEASLEVKRAIFDDKAFLRVLEGVANCVVESLKADGKVLFCGNGGSAGDAQHLAAELSGRFYYDRPPLFAEALHVNTSYLTAVANDYAYDEIYARSVQGKGRKGDVLVGISTSGNSKNVIRALEEARSRGMITVGLTGEGGGKMAPYCDYLLDVPSTSTPRIQEAHILVGHILCELVEAAMFPQA
ncbi:MAG: phosphoheptose isomerase [Bacteroidetes bacterium]|nr:MAG: phosphoheptose isomerase [Bacteroidota bacterium]